MIIIIMTLVMSDWKGSSPEFKRCFDSKYLLVFYDHSEVCFGSSLFLLLLTLVQ